MSADRQIGLVEIRRRRGRIPGFGSPSMPVEVLWCGSNRPRKKFGDRRDGWSFPPRVRELLLQETVGKTVVHFFGGFATFGVRLDIDPLTRPDVVGDAYFPPFKRDSFDCVILDPPYEKMHAEEKTALIHAAAWVARRRVYWLHTDWIATNAVTPCDHAWLIRVGDQCAIRVLQRFKVREPKYEPMGYDKLKRGIFLKYKRWRLAGERLPFSDFFHIGIPNGNGTAGGGQ